MDYGMRESFQGRGNSTYKLPERVGVSLQMPWGELASVVTRSQSYPAPMRTAPARAVQRARLEAEAESRWRLRFPTEDQDQAREGKLEDSRRPLRAAPVGRAAGPEP